MNLKYKDKHEILVSIVNKTSMPTHFSTNKPSYDYKSLININWIILHVRLSLKVTSTNSQVTFYLQTCLDRLYFTYKLKSWEVEILAGRAKMYTQNNFSPLFFPVLPLLQ